MSDIGSAASREERDELSETLLRFAYKATEAASLLRASDEKLSDLSIRLESIVKTTMSARSKLYGPPGIETSESMNQDLAEMQEVVFEIHKLAVEIRNDPGKPASS